MSRAVNSAPANADLLAGMHRLCARTDFSARLRRAFVIFWVPLIAVALLASVVTAIAQLPLHWVARADAFLFMLAVVGLAMLVLAITLARRYLVGSQASKKRKAGG